MKRLVEALAADPRTFDLLRWILEAGYRGELAVLAREGAAGAVSVLDLGCGTGVMAKAFAAQRYVGVDPNPRYIAHARRVHPAHRFEVMDGRALSFPDASFEVVLIAGVVHHLGEDDARRVLEEARRVLTHGVGRLLMWEDVPTRSRWNWVGRLVHRLDEGDFIRPAERYIEMTRSVFGARAVRSFPMSSGVCDYVTIVARREASSGPGTNAATNPAAGSPGASSPNAGSLPAAPSA